MVYCSPRVFLVNFILLNFLRELTVISPTEKPGLKSSNLFLEYLNESIVVGLMVSLFTM